MVFLAGPRQVGKTTLAQMLPSARRGYLNWDVPEDRERILLRHLPPTKLWVFDEIHKYRAWRNYLKGLYDSRPDGTKILVTGSARLEVYRFGGDSSSSSPPMRPAPIMATRYLAMLFDTTSVTPVMPLNTSAVTAA